MCINFPVWSDLIDVPNGLFLLVGLITVLCIELHSYLCNKSWKIVQFNTEGSGKLLSASHCLAGWPHGDTNDDAPGMQKLPQLSVSLSLRWRGKANREGGGASGLCIYLELYLGEEDTN